MSRWGLAPLLALFSGCSGDSPSCPEAPSAQVLGNVAAAALDEASGVAWGGGDVWFTHNDTASSGALFALDTTGALLATFGLDSVNPSDMEDIARYEDDEGLGLYLADIGDNGLNDERYAVIRVPMPDVSGGDAELTVNRTALRYADDGSRDSEGFAIDPRDGAIYVFTKEDGVSEVWRGDSAKGLEVVLEQVATIDFSADWAGSDDGIVTAASFSLDGAWLAVRTQRVAWMYSLADSASVAAALAGAPCPVLLAEELQGESIGFSDEGFLTLSEGAGQPMHFYPW